MTVSTDSDGTKLSPLRARNEQNLDNRKGFAYLESFSELEDWKATEVDPIHRANTPLYLRPSLDDNARGKSGSKVMLIHDYAGGYNDYECAQGTAAEIESYSCNYLHNVDSFVYFSHKLLSVPPPTWTNTCHRNGVKALGTFLVERGSKDVERILEQDEHGNFWVAQKLASLANCYGFDGFLINIETTFSLLAWSANKLEDFLRQLRYELRPSGKLVWYDALTSLNFVWYQNTLNHLNLPMALAAGSMLTNYAWTPELAKRGKQMAEQSGLGVENLYFGIDAWAQNIQKGPHSRVTWPSPGGGGTGIGLGMRALQHIGRLSTAIFAPAWSYEHFPHNGAAVDRSVWLGQYLPNDCSCDCDPEQPHSAVPYQQNGINRYSETNVLGTDRFFHTDFRRVFSKDSTTGHMYAHVGAQSPVIQQYRASAMICGTQNSAQLQAKLADSPSRCTFEIDIASPEDSSAGKYNCALRFASLHMNFFEKRTITVKYRRLTFENCSASLVFGGPKKATVVELSSETGEITTATEMLEPDADGLSGISLACECEDASKIPGGKIAIVELLSITIQPWLRQPSKCEPTNIRAGYRGPSDSRCLRIVWDIISDSSGTDGVPFSGITGSSAFFNVFVNGKDVGRAYALEFDLTGTELEDWKSADKADVRVVATGFDGTEVGSAQAVLQWPHDDEVEWVLVPSQSE